MATIHTVTTTKGEKRYQVRWWEGPGHQRKRTFGRFEEARRYKTQIERQRDVGEYVSPALGRISLAEWYELVMSSSPHLQPSTRASYEVQMKNHVLPRLGGRRLASISRGDVEGVVAEMRAQGCGGPTIEAAHKVLRRVLSAAVAGERLSRNPATGIRLGHAEEREPRFLSSEEVALIAAAVPPRDHALILLLAYTGLRIGEASALRVKHIDLFRRRVYVMGAAKEVGGRRLEGPTKTRAVRSVQLPAFLSDELMQHRVRHSDPDNQDAYYFTGRDGAPIRANNWRKRVLYPACDAAGVVPRPRTHDLRHTAASLAIQAGAHPKAIQEMLGHSSITMTLDRYGHLFDSLQEDMAERLDMIYRSTIGVRG